MAMFKKIPMAVLAIVAGTVITLGWILFEGTLPLVLSIVGGGLIALRGAVGS